MSQASRRVIVVGGGVIGTACAYELSRSGWRVTVIDRGAFGAGCSHGNCGLICPSHVLPLAEPGAVRQTLKALCRRNAPFAIAPRFDPALWSWLWHFARRCNRRDMHEAARAIQPLLASSIARYRQIIPREALDCEWQTRGVLHVYKSRAAMDAYSETDHLLHESFHCPARRLDGDELVAFEPALQPGLAGGWYYEQDAHLRPDRLLASWRRVLERQGVTIHEHCGARGFVTASRLATAIETPHGPLSADAFVVATGAWTPEMGRHLGCRIPIQPGKGYSLTMPRPETCLRVPVIFPETRVAATPFASGYRLGSTMEFAGYNSQIHPKRLQLLKDGARPYLRVPYCDPIEEAWYGWRPMTFDSLPIIDRSPRYENVLIAAGHNMLGLSMAPATGKLVSELLNGDPPHLDPSPYRINRFYVQKISE